MLFAFPESFTEAIIAQAIACSICKNDRAVLFVGARGIHTFKFGFESFTQITSTKLERVFPCHSKHAWIGLYAAVASAYPRAFRVEAAERFYSAYSGNAELRNSTLIIGKVAVFALEAIVISGTCCGHSRTISVVKVVYAFAFRITEEFFFDGHTVRIVDVTGRADFSAQLSCTCVPRLIAVGFVSAYAFTLGITK